MNKRFLTYLMLLTLPSISYAQSPLATGSAELFNAAKSYELVIDGDVAKKLFNTLDNEQSTTKINGEWTLKISNGIVCGYTDKESNYSCSIVIDREGVQN